MEFPGSFPAGDDAILLFSAFSADELNVADILLDLAGELDLSRRIPPSWGAKRRRSVLDNPPPAAGKSDFSSTSPNSPFVLAFNVDSDSSLSLPKKLQAKKDGLSVAFSHVDSDSSLSLPKALQAKKDELSIDSGRSTETREYLNLEVKGTKLSRDKLMAESMKLQETEQLMHELVSDGSLTLELRLMSQAEPPAQPPGASRSKEVGPKGIIIPDLNAPAEEFIADVERPQPSDPMHLQTAAAAKGGAEAAALARRNRRLIQLSRRARRGSR